MTTYQDTLAAYLDRPENTETALADRIGKSQAAVNRYRNGERFPDSDTAKAIEQHTGGEVSFAVWRAEFLTRSGLAA